MRDQKLIGVDAIIVTMSNTSQVVLPKIAQERLKRLEARTANIGVIGLGYVGLPLSLLLSEAGFKVTGFDIDARRWLTSKPDDPTSSAFQPKRFRVRAAGIRCYYRFCGALRPGRHHHVRPTPLTEHREPDLSYVENTAKAAAPWMQGRAAGSAREHDLSRHDRRADDSGARRRATTPA